MKPTTALLDKFLDDVTVPRTRAAYKTGCSVFMEFLDEREIDADVLIEFWRWLRKRKPQGQWQKDTSHLSDQTVRSYISAAVAFLSFLLDENALPESFSLDKAQNRLRRVSKVQRKPYATRKPDERLPLVVLHYDRIALPANDTPAHARSRLILLRARAVVHVLYATAGRISEVAQLLRSDVGDGRSDSAIITGKGAKRRTLFLTAEAKQAMAAYVAERRDADKALWVGHRRKGKLGTRALWMIVKQAARAEGLPDIHPHDFRHLRASQMLSEGARLEEVQEILGHADIGTTRKIYAAFSTVAVREAFDAYRLSPAEALQKAES